jgi:predicted dehydrogenase
VALRIGVVGLGHLGKFHLENLVTLAKRRKDCEVVGACDLNPAARDLAAKAKVPFFTDYRDLADLVDAVTIVVPTTYHHETGLFFLERGIHCLIEKPLAKSVAEAEALCEAAEAKGVVLQTGHVERFNPIVRAAQPYLGRPRFIQAVRVSPYPFRSTDVGVTLDLMIHDIDLAVALVGEEPGEIRAAGAPVFSPSEDVANVRLEFSSAVASVEASRVSIKKERKLRIFQEDAYLSLDLLNNDGVYIEKSEALKSGEIDPASLSPSILGQAGLALQLGKLVNRKTLKGAKVHSLEAELDDFLDCVLTKRAPLVDGRAGLRALRVAERVLACMRRV